MSEPTAQATPPFIIDSLTLRETRLLQLALTDVFPAPATPLAHTAHTKAEILFNSQFDDNMRVDVHTTITATDKVKKGVTKPRVQVRVAVLFHYVGLGELRRSNTLPLPLAWTAVSLAYSTLRGMLQVKLAGTSFAQVLLPIVNPQQLWEPSATPAVTSSDAPEA
ncbi:MAG: hypothetical protein EOO62_12735 [Hymenobacter sp.]|nr:MAG: hypothetical protein EOO62_12735 [Hymenobacter sp.]